MQQPVVAVVDAERSEGLDAIAHLISGCAAGTPIQRGLEVRTAAVRKCTANGGEEGGPFSQRQLPFSLCRPAIPSQWGDDTSLKNAALGESSVGTTRARSRNSLRISQDVSAISEQLWQAAPCSHLSSNPSFGLCWAQTGSLEHKAPARSARSRCDPILRACWTSPPRVPSASGLAV